MPPSPNFIDDPSPKLIKAPRKRRQAKEIKILGHKDPRGPDNSVYVWVDESGLLRIRVLKAQRCYQFQEMIDRPDYVEIVAK